METPGGQTLTDKYFPPEDRNNIDLNQLSNSSNAEVSDDEFWTNKQGKKPKQSNAGNSHLNGRKKSANERS